MSKHLLNAALLACLLAGGAIAPAAAQAPQEDSLSVEQLQEVVIGAVRATKNAPFAVANIGRRELQDFSTTGIELPRLFARTPGIISWSENGVGTGTSYMRIRGAGGSRINVTLDGVPLNSPEDQTVFWANMNSYGALMGSVQIQRGVGASTNGDGAFGGTIALGTKAPSLIPSAEYSLSYGSYNTVNWGGSVSSGLLWNHLIIEGALRQTSTDGYIHGTDGRSGSYYGGLTWLGRGWKLSYKLIGNFENTGQAWNGVTAGNNDLSIMDGTYGTKTGIKTYADMWNAGLGQYNSLYELMSIDGTKYTVDRYRMSDGSFWPRTTDNFEQTHHILNFAWDINDWWKLSVSPHYTHGYGYYDEFRYQNKINKYGMEYFKDAQGNKVKKTDLVRQKGLLQDTYGVVANVMFRKDAWDVVGGASVQQFKGNHFGYLTYAANPEVAARYGISASDPRKYYDSDASKLDASAYLRASLALSDAWSVFGDLQYRHVHFKTDGYNDKYVIDKETDIPSKHMLDVDVRYHFFNPKAGVNFGRDGHRAFASFAMSHREPERNNFTDNGKYPAPRAERLLDGEMGYQFDGRRWRAGVTLYYMRYKDQLVQTGAVSDIGEPLTTNIPDSYRMGAELTAGWDITRWLTIEGNAALSRNRLLDFDEVIEDWDDWEGNPDYALYHCDGNGDEARSFHHTDKTLAFSPSAILNGFVNVHFGGFRAVWHTGYVSRMYLDNSENMDRSLPAYSLSDFSLGYTFKPGRAVKEVDLGVDFNNVFSARVAQSGWVYSAVCESYGHTPENRYYQIGFVPVAPLTVLGHITLRF
ncbi:MAG: TonB-dependent receptor plug domain-containing protein [Bacteroidales bacterium]|nr:TonB-dependent receptor plug domain-containing protein [Bacteroidales bacterium]